MIRRYQFPLPCLLAALALAIQACTVLAPRPDTSRFFLLTPGEDASAVSSPPASPNRQLAIGVGPVGLPGYLRRPEIVSRTGADQLVLSAQDRWAEPLDSNFESVLAQDLSRKLQTQQIVLFPWYGNPQLDYRVEVEVHRFDSGPDGQAHLTADWTIKDGHTGATMFASRTVASSPIGGGDAGVPAALSLDLDTLSDQIAGQIVGLNRNHATIPQAE
ncbi:MAG TPA: PqiC family protein [Candidatus Binataceae bacterium]|nr:PqiC family protein [Candidatus Binataceae bacterium]